MCCIWKAPLGLSKISPFIEETGKRRGLGSNDHGPGPASATSRQRKGLWAKGINLWRPVSLRVFLFLGSTTSLGFLLPYFFFFAFFLFSSHPHPGRVILFGILK